MFEKAKKIRGEGLECIYLSHLFSEPQSRRDLALALARRGTKNDFDTALTVSTTAASYSQC
jgi:hypothetical protein